MEWARSRESRALGGRKSPSSSAPPRESQAVLRWCSANSIQRKEGLASLPRFPCTEDSGGEGQAHGPRHAHTCTRRVWETVALLLQVSIQGRRAEKLIAPQTWLLKYG